MMDYSVNWSDSSEAAESADLPEFSETEEFCGEMEEAESFVDFADSVDLTAAEDPEYAEYREQMLQLNPDIDEETILALSKDVADRTSREVELVDLARHPDYEDQLSFACDDVTGEALLDENGDLVQVPRNTPFSQRPDGALRLEDGAWDFRECKSYSGSSAYNNLRATIREQSGDRFTALGDQQHTTFVIAANDLTVHDADRLQDLAQDCGCDLEFQTK